MITSTSNPIIKDIRQLVKSSSKRKEERLFVAEGKRLVFDLIFSGALPKTILATRDFLKKELFPEVVEEKVITEVSDHILNSVSDTKSPQGVMAVFSIPKYNVKDVIVDTPLILVLDSVRDPGNMGTIFRTFEAAGGSGIFLVNNCTDLFSPKCIRSTMGSAVRLPFVVCEDTNTLKKMLSDIPNLQIFASDMSGENYYKKDYTGATAFIIGNEANGISKDVVQIAHETVGIPMSGQVESLNAAISCGILSFEAKRQRL